MRVKDEGKQEALYLATVRLAAKRGLGKITMSQIAKEAGVATGTIYVYFKNKEALIVRAYEFLKLKGHAQVFGESAINTPYLVTMKELFVSYLHYCIEFQAELVFMNQVENSAYLQKVPVESAEALDGPLEEFLTEGKRQMLVKNFDNQLLIASIHGITRQLASLVASGRMVADHRGIDDMFQTCWGAIKA